MIFRCAHSHLIKFLAAAIPLSALGGGGQIFTPPVLLSLHLEPCRLEHPDRLQSVEARCGFLAVPENPADPDGHHIRLRVGLVPALNRDGPADPLFVLAGGPGQAATEFYTLLAPAFARIQRDRDIVLVDQRGTGGSNALNCEFPDEEEAAQLSAEQIRAATRDCLASLPADPLYYTTSVAVQDLERVRVALEYEKINLYGISYGTRVAQHYLRRYAQRVRAVILDGVIPAEQVLGVDSAIHAQRALDQVFARCRASDACRKAFSDPAVHFETLRRRLTSAPAQVSFPDPVTAAVVSSPVRLTDLQMTVRMMSYASDQSALIPLVLHEGAVRGNLAPLAGQARMIESQLMESMSIGMHNAVVCTEDAPFFASTPTDRQALRESYLGTSQLDLLTQMCEIWPRGVIDGDFHAFLESPAPILLLSGSADPVTPPTYAEAALRGFTNGLHVVLEGQGHGQLALGCVPELMAKFLRSGSTRNLDVSCSRSVIPGPFFTSFSGPPP